MSSRSFSKYVHKAEKKLAQLAKKQELRPVNIEGSVIAATWWGKAWNKNLESCADYADTLGRGRSIVQCGAILDLQISAGVVKALVQGTRAKPHAITITIHKLHKNTLNQITSAHEAKPASLEELFAAKFSEAFETFIQRKTGLFPSPEEIEFACTCPDWASMCKHSAAALYGIGARIDEDPLLLFTLRGVHAVDLIKRTRANETVDLFQKASQKDSLNPGEESASSLSKDAAKAINPDAESVRMADVRKILKKQLKMDIKLAKKETSSSKTTTKKKIVKGKANEIVHKVVTKKFRPGMTK